MVDIVEHFHWYFQYLRQKMTSKAHEGRVEALLKDINSFENRTEDVHANEAGPKYLCESGR